MPVNDDRAALDALATASPDEARAALGRLVSVTAATLERRAQLEQALSTRIVIEQAKGILAERFRIGIDEAFQVLRGAARSERTKLREVAQAVVSARETPPAIRAALDARSRER